MSDPVYNTQMGAAEVAALLHEYRGSYIMTFAGYNAAGRGRVQQWVAQHGDPRDPEVDAVDWVERIPFAETRNYVQRVMENLQVYCARFGARTATVEPNLHRRASVGSRAEPVLVEAVPWSTGCKPRMATMKRVVSSAVREGEAALRHFDRALSYQGAISTFRGS